jgi:hypothetical protein
MPELSARTIAEMEAGALTVARHQRLKTLDTLVKKGHARVFLNNTIAVGTREFPHDGVNSFPTVLQMANVALAIEAGQHLMETG